MSDPKFIRNKEPHQVSMPEGSRVAASKSADVGGPSVRNTLVEDELMVSEEIDPLLNLDFEIPDVSSKLAKADLKGRDEIPDVSTVEDVFIDTSIPSFSTEYLETEMNFPARLINLKIENDRVKTEMSELENLMSSGI